jgi:dipeptidyl aminopeptidase/acylaminoacyl peptidase
MEGTSAGKHGRRGPTAEALLAVRTPAEIAMTPDGAKVVFTVHAAVSERDLSLPSDLWMLGDQREPDRLTGGEWADTSPVWSPDGSRLAFISDRTAIGHHLPYTMTPGHEPILAGTFVGSTEHVSWSADGERLLVLAADPGSYSREVSGTAVTGGASELERGIRTSAGAWRRLLMVDLASGYVTEVGPPGLSVWEVDWDGAGTVVAIVAENPTGNGWYRSKLARLDLDARTAEILYEPTWQLEGLALSPDASRAAVVEGYSSDPALLNGSVLIVDLTQGKTTDPWPGLETVGLAAWCDPESLWYGRMDGTGTACGRIWLDGRREETWARQEYIGADVCKPQCAVADGGAVVMTTHEAHGVPPELARLDHGTGEWVRLTSFNDAAFAGVEFPDVRTISWASTDGLEIEGRLMTPRGAAGPLPLIVAVHGGPTWCWNAFFSVSEPNAVVLATAGYAVLLPNPRGSTGRSHAFAQAVLGDPGGKDFEDIMAGVDLCIADGVADPGRLGITGLSYGGYMAGWAVTQTDRFGAAVAHSVVSNYISFHLTSEVAGFDEMILDGVWTDPAGAYAERSPIFHAQGCTTPTLVIQGQIDRCTPVGQGEELFGAIAASGTETELVVYPREGHVPVEREHSLDAIVRTQAWFDRHLRDGDAGPERLP